MAVSRQLKVSFIGGLFAIFLIRSVYLKVAEEDVVPLRSEIVESEGDEHHQTRRILQAEDKDNWKFKSLDRKLNAALKKWSAEHDSLETMFSEEVDSEMTPVEPGTRYKLGDDIRDWDKQRAAYIKAHPGCNVTKRGRPKVLLVTGSQPKWCPNDVGDHLLLKALKNKIDYTNRWDIEIYYGMGLFDRNLDSFWSKQPMVRKLMLTHPSVEWIWWMDSDAMFTDMLFEVPWDRYKNHNFVLHGWEDAIDKKDWVGANAGIFLMRNSQWALDFLEEWVQMGPRGIVRDQAGVFLYNNLRDRPVFEGDDQCAMVWIMATQKKKWSPKIYLENKYYLHGYWILLTHRYEEMMLKHHAGLGDDRWPFITHFVGCKPCTKTDTVSLEEQEKCIEHMQRAFNFADNQVLHDYGYEHLDLASSTVIPIERSATEAAEVTESTEGE